MSIPKAQPVLCITSSQPFTSRQRVSSHFGKPTNRWRPLSSRGHSPEPPPGHIVRSGLTTPHNPPPFSVFPTVSTKRQPRQRLFRNPARKGCANFAPRFVTFDLHHSSQGALRHISASRPTIEDFAIYSTQPPVSTRAAFLFLSGLATTRARPLCLSPQAAFLTAAISCRHCRHCRHCRPSPLLSCVSPTGPTELRRHDKALVWHPASRPFTENNLLPLSGIRPAHPSSPDKGASFLYTL